MKKTKPKRRPKRIHIPGIVQLAYPRKEEVDAFEAEVYKFEFLVETALPKGQCTADDLQQILDNINLTALILARPKSRAWLDKDAVDEAIPDMMAAVKAMESLALRRLKTHSTVCTAEELNAIRKASLYAGEVLHRSLKECPMMTFKEFFVQKKLLSTSKPERVAVNVKKFDELVHTEWVELRRRFGSLI